MGIRLLSRGLGVVLLIAACPSVFPATLEKLALDDMVVKSTEIVRGRVTGISTSRRGSLILTQVSVAVTERWKGPEAATVEVVLHGGTFQGLRQTFAGTPELRQNGEYLFFLWAGRSGLRQIIGLSQGLLGIQLSKNSSTGTAQLMAGRPPLGGMIDPASREEVQDGGLSLPLDQLRVTVKRMVASAGARE